MSSGPVHVLHIRKTGGTAIKAALLAVAGLDLDFHRHHTTLAHLPPGEAVAVCVRDPVTRFVSGFNSRLRQGAPRYDRPWTAAEAEAFGRFSTPGALAEALAEADPRAEEAMTAIREIGRPQTDWLPQRLLRQRSGDLVWIGFTEFLSEDFERLKMVLGLPLSIALPTGEVETHRMPAGQSKLLSERGRAAIQRRFAGDYRLLEALRRIELPISGGRPQRGWRRRLHPLGSRP